MGRDTEPRQTGFWLLANFGADFRDPGFRSSSRPKNYAEKAQRAHALVIEISHIAVLRAALFSFGAIVYDSTIFYKQTLWQKLIDAFF